MTQAQADQILGRGMILPHTTPTPPLPPQAPLDQKSPDQGKSHIKCFKI